MTDWAAHGLLDGLTGRDRQARTDLLETLEAEGYTIDNIKRSNREGELLFLMAGRAINVSVQYSWKDLVEKSGLPEELIARLLRSQGITRADDDSPWYTEADLELLTTTNEFIRSGVTEEEILTVSRLLGKGLSQAAEAMRGVALRLVLEPGLGERDLAVRYAHTAELLTPMLEPMLANLLRLHLAKLVQTELISAEEREAGRLPGARPIVVAFADLVGFTRLGEEVAPDQLGAVAGRLENMVLEVIASPVRFVKTIGDAVMVVSPEAEPLLDAGLTLAEAADAEGEDFPQLRVGVAAGEALGRAGDWYGRPVNLASRLTGIARAGSVLATGDVQELAPDRYAWSKAGVRSIKGVADAVPLWRARRLTPGADR
ncbi:MAG: adenylate cyclase [Solirubrobacteraceae bacterium]|nr:adenylate cyclase [Solirubrobacteraceae bacterium]